MLTVLRQSARRTRKRLRKRLNHQAAPLRKQLRLRFQERQLARQVRHARPEGAGRPGPDFVVIGAPKCATSWLLHALCRHPQIVMVQEEVEYFTKKIHLPLDWYLELFEETSPALNQANAGYRSPFAQCRVGEKSASYCALPPKRIRLLRELRPDARLILLIRDPIRRHWAHTKRFFSKQYFGKKGLDLSAIDEREILDFFEKTRRFGEYSLMIRNWRREFDPSQLLILVQEEIFQAPQQAYAQALGHIGLSPGGAEEVDLDSILGGRRNRGPEVPLPDHLRVRLEEMFRPEYDRLKRVLDRPLPAAWAPPA